MLWLMAYAFAVLSAVLASLYGFMSAEGSFAYAKAAILAAASFFGAHGLAWAREFYERRGAGAAGLCYIATTVCFLVTLWGGLGTMSAGSSRVSAERTHVAASAALDRAKLSRLQGERRALTARPAATINAELLTMRSQPAYRISNSCDPEHITVGRTREFCDGYRRAEAELARAKDMARLDAEIAATEDRLRTAPPEIVADPQAAAFSALTGLTVEVSGALYALAASIAIELAAAMTMIKAHLGRQAPADRPRPVHIAPERPTPRPRQEPVERPAIAAQPPQSGMVYGSVRKFLEAELVPGNESIAARAVFTRYREWCAEMRGKPAPLNRFFAALEEHCGDRIEWRGDQAYCSGYGLKSLVS